MSVEEHIAALLDGDRGARDTAAFELRALQFDPQLLVPVLEHPHVSRQVKAIEVLRYSRTRQAIELLVPMLGSQHDLVARKAASSLGRIGAIAPEVIADALDTASTAQHRLHVLDALSRLRHPRGREVLLVQADAWEPWQRTTALDYLRRYREDPPVETVRAALGDPETRHAAIEVAGKLRDPSFVEPLLAIWLGEERFPPIEALFEIGKFGAVAIDPIVARAADPALRDRVAKALDQCLVHVAEAQFWQVWTRPEPAIRDACLQHLGSGYARSFAAARRRTALAAHVRDPDQRRRLSCIRAYEQLGRLPNADVDAAREALEALSSDPDETVRTRAETALRSLANST